MREATKRGAPIEIEDFERRLRSQEPRRGSPGNPLRELARLMQSEEQVEAALRYARMFGEQNPVPPAEEERPDYSSRPAKRARGREEAIRAAVPQAEVNVQHAWREPPEPIGESDLPPPLRGRLEYEDYESYSLDPARAAPTEDYPQDYHAGAAEDAHYHGQFEEDHGYGHAHEHYASEEAQAYAHAGTAGDEVDFSDASLGRTQSGGDMHPAWEEEAPAAPQSRLGGLKSRLPLGGFKGRLRPWHGVALVALVAAGGIAMALGHIKGKIGSRDIVTIAAPTGPVRVAPTANQEEASNASQTPALDPQEAAPVNQVEAHQEQPVEPVVTAPPQRVEHGLAPKRVKTLSIRAGVPVDAGAAPAAVERAAAGAPKPHSTATTTPKTPAHAATTGQAGKPAHQKVAVAEPPADGAADAGQPEAASEGAGNLSKGGFAVQFGAAGSEAEARSVAAKVAQKYASHLGGHKPSYKMATVGDKTVYRVRVGGISKEAATSLCSAVKSNGGSCFVAAN